MDIFNSARYSSCPPGYTPNFNKLLQAQDDWIFLGDFNARHPSRYSATSNCVAAIRGIVIHDSHIDSELLLFNTDSPTRLPEQGISSSPDLTASTHIEIDSEWFTLTILSSDHLPILAELGNVFSMTCPELPHRTFTSVRKAYICQIWCRLKT